MGGIRVKWVNEAIWLTSEKLHTGEEIVKVDHRRFVINHDEPYTINDFCPGEVFTFRSNVVNRFKYKEAFVYLNKWKQKIQLHEDQLFTITFFDYKKVGDNTTRTEALIGHNSFVFLKQIW